MKTNWITLAAATAATLLIGTGRADAGLIIMAPSVTAAAGSRGTFDVVLENTGAASVSIGGFSFGLSTSNPGITFSGATTSTIAAPYLFAGDSLFGPTISIATGTALTASDNPLSFPYYDVAAGASVGLGHIAYSVSGSAPSGPFAITFAPPATSLADKGGSPITIDAMKNGSITVASTPEPGTIALLLGGSLLIAGKRSRPKRKGSFV